MIGWTRNHLINRPAKGLRKWVLEVTKTSKLNNLKQNLVTFHTVSVAHLIKLYLLAQKKCANEKLTRHLLMKHISSSSKKRFHMQKAPSIFMPISYRIDNILVNIKKRPKNFLFCLYTDWLIESCPSLSKWFDMSKFPEIMENMAKKVWK